MQNKSKNERIEIESVENNKYLTSKINNMSSKKKHWQYNLRFAKESI